MISRTTTMCEPCAEENHHPLFSYPQVYQAYLNCRRTKRNSLRALSFEMNHEELLMELVDELQAGRYLPGTSICFYTRKPKYREIFAADFRDRIVHHLVYHAISPIWERIFIHHSYACRPQRAPMRLPGRFRNSSVWPHRTANTVLIISRWTSGIFYEY